MLNINDVKILYIKDIAKLLGRTTAATTQLLYRSPNSFPQEFKIPGLNRRMWLEKDVIEWINNCRTNKTIEDK